MTKLQKYLKENGISIMWLSKKLEMTYTKTLNIVCGKTALKASDAQTISKILHLDLEDII